MPTEYQPCVWHRLGGEDTKIKTHGCLPSRNCQYNLVELLRLNHKQWEDRPSRSEAGEKNSGWEFEENIYTEERHPSWVWKDQFIHKELGGGHSKDEESHKGETGKCRIYKGNAMEKSVNTEQWFSVGCIYQFPGPTLRQLNQKLWKLGPSIWTVF